MSALLTYTVRFLSPAFLGNAEQSGQWRTPPFKALLRQWWRVAFAADHRFPADMNPMRGAEGRLFGAVADGGNSNQSRVRLRLDRWDSGRLKRWESIGTVHHPEVGQHGQNIGADLYLGYGPLKFEKGTALKSNAAIHAGEQATLRVAVAAIVTPEAAARVSKALALINLYGALGGRSRNGWGSFLLEPQDGSAGLPALDAGVQRPWRRALTLDWPHAIGCDDTGALIWQTEAFGDWKAAMRKLAELKIRLRTQFQFVIGQPNPQERHWLSYPVTHHQFEPWGNRLRLPNSLRFKLRRDPRDSAKLRGIVFHVPCLPPREFNPRQNSIVTVWERVHRFLDHPDQKLTRIPL